MLAPLPERIEIDELIDRLDESRAKPSSLSFDSALKVGDVPCLLEPQTTILDTGLGGRSIRKAMPVAERWRRITAL